MCVLDSLMFQMYWYIYPLKTSPFKYILSGFNSKNSQGTNIQCMCLSNLLSFKCLRMTCTGSSLCIIQKLTNYASSSVCMGVFMTHEALILEHPTAYWNEL